MKRWLAVILILGALMGRIPPVLRLHVVANSDTKADQDVKLLVRDAVMGVLSGPVADYGRVRAG